MNLEGASPLFFPSWHSNLQLHVLLRLTVKELAIFSTSCKKVREYTYEKFLHFRVNYIPSQKTFDLLQLLSSKTERFLDKVDTFVYQTGDWTLFTKALQYLPNLKVLRTGFSLCNAFSFLFIPTST